MYCIIIGNYCRRKVLSKCTIKIAIELFETKNELPPPVPKELFNQTTINYNLRYFSDLAHNAKIIFHCTKSISAIGRKIRGTVPGEFDELSSLSLFRKAIKNVNLKIILLGYARHTSRISGFSIVYYFLGFVFIQLLILPPGSLYNH